jgi:hypothetical protein
MAPKIKSIIKAKLKQIKLSGRFVLRYEVGKNRYKYLIINKKSAKIGKNRI